MATTEFTPEELAEALHNLMLANAQAVGDENAPKGTWETLGYEDQLPWRTIAHKAPHLMENLEGLTFDVVAFNMFQLIRPEGVTEEQAMERFGHMHVLYRLMWESLARFLHAAFDSEDGDLGDAFDVFRDWFKRKADAIPRILTA